MAWLLDALYLLGLALASPWLLWRAWRPAPQVSGRPRAARGALAH